MVFQHIDCEHPGIFRRFFGEARIEWHVVKLDSGEQIPPLERFDALWVMGGPMDVWDTDSCPWLTPEKEAIRRWAQTLKKPFLGLCLGHQLLADTLGGRCERADKPEIGILDVDLAEEARDDPLLRGGGGRVHQVFAMAFGVSENAPAGCFTPRELVRMRGDCSFTLSCKSPQFKSGVRCRPMLRHLERPKDLVPLLK